MRFNVSQLLKEPLGSKRVYDVEEPELIPTLEESPIQGVRGRVTLMRTDKGILATADLDCHALCSCSRCLGTYSQSLRVHMEEEFFPTADMNTGVPLNLAQLGGEDFWIDGNHILDLTEAARQYAIMTLPMKPLCGEECCGICSYCGVNLNDSQCQCGEAPRDIHRGPLMDLLPRSNT